MIWGVQEDIATFIYAHQNVLLILKKIYQQKGKQNLINLEVKLDMKMDAQMGQSVIA